MQVSPHRAVVRQGSSRTQFALTLLIIGMGFAVALKFVLDAAEFGLGGHAVSSDYVNILTGSRLLNQGHGAADLYNLARQVAVQQAITAPFGRVNFPDGLLPFISPPFVAIIHLPLNQMPLPLSFVIWVVVQLAAFVLSLRLLAVLLPTHYRLLLWVGGFAYLPVQQVFDQGQVSCLVLLGVVLLWQGLRRRGGAEWGGGFALGLLLLKPQLLPLFLLYLLYYRRWLALGGFALAAAIWYLLSAAVSGFDWPIPYLQIIDWVGQQRDHYSVYPEGMFSWRGISAGFGVDSGLPALILALLTALVLLYSWYRTPKTNASATPLGDIESQLAAVTVAAALDSFYLYIHDLTVLVFSGVVLLGWGTRHGWPRWLAVLLLAGLFAPITVVPINGWPFNLLVVAVMVAAFAALIWLANFQHTASEAIGLSVRISLEVARIC